MSPEMTRISSACDNRAPPVRLLEKDIPRKKRARQLVRTS